MAPKEVPKPYSPKEPNLVMLITTTLPFYKAR
jgi:hypothetical protein